MLQDLVLVLCWNLWMNKETQFLTRRSLHWFFSRKVKVIIVIIVEFI